MLLPILPSEMYCWAWNRIYIKANGRIPCWCNSGESHTLSKFDHSLNFIDDIVNSENARRMRVSIHGLGQEYISECSKCCCLSIQGQIADQRYIDSEDAEEAKGEAFSVMSHLKHTQATRGWPLGSISHINEIQVEPSLPCNLTCPGCPQRNKSALLASEGPPYTLDLSLFKKMLDDCNEASVSINRLHYCGKGEPTLCKNLEEMIAYAYSQSIKQSIDTNSNQPFKDAYLMLDRLNCSIDGSTSESYVKYRRGGDFAKAIRFMTDAVKRKQETNSNLTVRWKYILFDTTEDTEQLNQAQEIAKQIGIDELDFVITACGAYDRSVRPPLRMNTTRAIEQYLSSNKIFSKVVFSRS